MLSYRCYMECALLDIRHGTEYTRQEECPLNQQAKKKCVGRFIHDERGTTVMPNAATAAAVNLIDITTIEFDR